MKNYPTYAGFLRNIWLAGGLLLISPSSFCADPMMEPDNLLKDIIPELSSENSNNPEAFYNSGWQALSGNGEILPFVSSVKGWSCFLPVENNHIQWGPDKENIFVGETDSSSVITLQYWDEELLPQPNTETSIAERKDLEYAHYVYPIDLDSSKYYFSTKAAMLTSHNNGTLTPLNLYNLLLIAFSKEPLGEAAIDVDADRTPMVEINADKDIYGYCWKVLKRPQGEIPQIVEIPWTELELGSGRNYINIYAPGQLVLIDNMELHKGISTDVKEISSAESAEIYFDLHGREISRQFDNLSPGFYIMMKDGKTEKIVKRN